MWTSQFRIIAFSHQERNNYIKILSRDKFQFAFSNIAHRRDKNQHFNDQIKTNQNANKFLFKKGHFQVLLDR